MGKIKNGKVKKEEEKEKRGRRTTKDSTKMKMYGKLFFLKKDIFVDKILLIPSSYALAFSIDTNPHHICVHMQTEEEIL